MPKVLRQGVPPALLRHLALRIEERSIGADQLVLFAQWLDREPEVPVGRWFKRFPGLIVCGEGELVKTFLRPGQAVNGEEIDWLNRLDSHWCGLYLQALAGKE